MCLCLMNMCVCVFDEYMCTHTFDCESVRGVLNVCGHVRIDARSNVCIHTQASIYIHTSTLCVCVCVVMYIHAYTYLTVHTYIHVAYPQTQGLHSIAAYIHTCTHTCMHTYRLCIGISAYIHTYVYTYMHTYTQALHRVCLSCC